MDSKALLNELLKTGKELASKGQSMAEAKLKIPEDGEGRDKTLDGMKKGAVAAGVLALLLGTGAGRRVTGSALKIGSLAAIGGIGYQAYQKWLAQRDGTEQETRNMTDDVKLASFDQLDTEQANERSTILLKAMVAAAKSDGHIDEQEISSIKEHITKLNLGGDITNLLKDEISTPLDVKEVAALAENQAIAAEIYLVSAVVTDKDNPVERAYLETLAQTMGLPDELVSQLLSAKESELT